MLTVLLAALLFLAMFCLFVNIEQAELAKKNKNVIIAFVGEEGTVETRPFSPPPTFKLYWIGVAIFLLVIAILSFAPLAPSPRALAVFNI